MKPVLAYITAKDLTEANHLSKKLLENRLVACVNVIKEVYSSFWWEGKIDQTQEVLMIAKTTSDCQDAISNLVSEFHSYQCPCILFLPLEGGSELYLDWIKKEIKPETREKL